MQGSWQQATRELEEGLFDEGRRVVRGVVAKMKDLVEMEGWGRGEDAGMKSARAALEAVERARVEFEKLVGEAKEGEMEEEDAASR